MRAYVVISFMFLAFPLINGVSVSKPLTSVHSTRSRIGLELKLRGGVTSTRSKAATSTTTSNSSEKKAQVTHNDGGAGVIVATSAALGSLLQGYDTGVLGGALLFIIPEFELSNRPLMQGLVVTTAAMGGIIGSILVSFTLGFKLFGCR
jgi:hypothetical protein